jgi:hypothetical protein
MKNFEGKVVKVISKLICDGCGEQATPDDYTFHEFISISKRCGYGSIHGDGKQFNIDLCQQCFADMCGDSLTITDPSNEEHDNEQTLEYQIIFEAITQSKKEALNLKHDSDLQVEARDILLANKISSKRELTAALKRVEQLWDVQYHSAEGNELHQLADLICKFEGKNWDSYFNSVNVVSNDFMAAREDVIEQKGAARGVLSDIKVNSYVDDDASLENSFDEDMDMSINQVLSETKVEILENIANIWVKYPDLRLTQLIVNAINPKSPCPEIFYIEDSQLLYKIKQL